MREHHSPRAKPWFEVLFQPIHVTARARERDQSGPRADTDSAAHALVVAGVAVEIAAVEAVSSLDLHGRPRPPPRATERIDEVRRRGGVVPRCHVQVDGGRGVVAADRRRGDVDGGVVRVPRVHVGVGVGVVAHAGEADEGQQEGRNRGGFPHRSPLRFVGLDAPPTHPASSNTIGSPVCTAMVSDAARRERGPWWRHMADCVLECTPNATSSPKQGGWRFSLCPTWEQGGGVNDREPAQITIFY